MPRRLAPALILTASALLLLGCSSPTAAPSASPAATPSASASAEPEVDPQLVVMIDGVSFTDDGGTTTAEYADPDALLALLEDATGELPEPEPVEGMEGYDIEMQAYVWDGLRVLTDTAGESPASMAVTAAEVDGIPVTTTEGLQVGSSRADLLDAGAWGIVDTDDPATAEYVGLGESEVPGTESLTHPGSVGILYTLFRLDGDTVTQINVPANDFSDI
ncbi:hypothetical protein ACFC14_11580 [Microbacterium sp. NPDC055988]|uniref:hypothetical protein n=1 Tax=Microbacterium sp. NPDC055988 TaxID=3345671 RepID=UPI0035E35E22